MQQLQSPVARWGTAAVIAVLAVLANLGLQQLIPGHGALQPYFTAVVLTAFFAGAAPAVAVLVTTCAAAWFLWSVLSPSIALSQRPLLVSMLIAGGLVALALGLYARSVLLHRKRAETRLHISLTAGRMAAWEWDLHTGNVTFSEGAQAVFGRTWTQVDEAWRVTHPDDVERVRAIVSGALATESHYSFVNRMILPGTGEVRHIETHGYVHRDARKRPTHVTGVTLDVTDRERAVQESEVARRRFEVALRSSHMIAWECDKDLRYTWVFNPHHGFRAEDFVGRKIGEVRPREHYPLHIEAIERVVATGRAERVPAWFDNGTEVRHYLSNIEPVLDASGQFRGLVGASLDVTDLQRAQQQLQQESRRKDEFVATLAHELRNPMAPIRYSLALLRDSAPPEVRDRARKVIERQCAHMARLLDDLLDMSRITRNVIELQKQSLDLREVAAQALQAVSSAMAEMRHTLVHRAPDAPVWVEADPTRLAQIVGNLLDNAGKYTPQGGTITLEIETQGDQACISVSDTGLGLTKQMCSEVFELFSQPHKAKHGSRGGLGIGLSVVRQLVALHGGRIEVESPGLDQGSTFRVFLPLAQPPARREAAREESRPAYEGRPRVLIVDDNVDAAESLAMLLAADGCDVEVAGTGTEALARLHARLPEVGFFDIGLPDLSGYELARHVRGLPGGDRVHLVAVTGWGQAQDRAQSQGAGFDLHLVKPVDPRTVEESISSFLAHRHAPAVDEAGT